MVSDVMTTDSEAERKRKAFGKDIAYGMQQTFTCWATDFIDPWIGEKIQGRYEDATHHAPKGATWYGEFIGDTAAFFAFLGVQKFAPGVTRSMKHMMRSTFDGMLDRTGRKHLRHEGIAPSSPEYKEKLEEWKEFQADNMAKSTFITVSSIAANVATQKMIGSTHKLGVITMSKAAGAAITMAAMMGMRFAIPKTTRKSDEELEQRYFSPLIRKTQKVFGAEPDKEPHPHKSHHHSRKKEASHSERITTTRANENDMVSQYGK